MPKINGISVKSLKEFYGHEGETCFQGNLYLGNRKIGFWSQDAHGGICDNVCLEPQYSSIYLDKEIERLNADKTVHGVSRTGEQYTIEYDITHLMSDYLNLVEDEKLFKKAIKKGYSAILIVTDGYHVTYFSLDSGNAALSDEQLKEKLSVQIGRAKAKMFKNEDKEIKIYRSLENFIVGEPINIKAITRQGE